uniref:Uncharacterized protein n=1 Tax=Romanomermis culicivorax TaxID=13658 RepID=A0A915J6S7_ROMCU
MQGCAVGGREANPKPPSVQEPLQTEKLEIYDTQSKNSLRLFWTKLYLTVLGEKGLSDSEEFKCLLQIRRYVSQKCRAMCIKPSAENSSAISYIVKSCERLRCIKWDCLMGKDDFFQRTPRSSECRSIVQRVMDEDYEKSGKFMALTSLKAIGKYKDDVTSWDLDFFKASDAFMGFAISFLLLGAGIHDS